MKKIVFTMTALLALATATMAQDNNNGERRAPRQFSVEDMTNRMADNLKLNDEQKTKVMELNKEYQEVLMAPRGFRGPRGPRPDGQTEATGKQDGKQNEVTERPQRPERPQMSEEQREAMKKNMEKRQEYDKKLKDILTEDQYNNWKQQQGRFGRPGGRHGGPRGGQRPPQQAQD